MGVRLKDLSMWGPPGCILTLEYQHHLFPELVSSSSTSLLKSPPGLLSKNQVENTTAVRSWKCPPLEAQVTAMQGKQLPHGSRVPARGAGSLNAEPAVCEGRPRVPQAPTVLNLHPPHLLHFPLCLGPWLRVAS